MGCTEGHEKKFASAGNRTRINCLEGSYADHYTTDAILLRMPSAQCQTKLCGLAFASLALETGSVTQGI